jgi:hypothetical protein
MRANCRFPCRGARPCSAYGMGAIGSWIRPDQCDPVVHEPTVLPRRDVFAGMAAAREQPIAGS